MYTDYEVPKAKLRGIVKREESKPQEVQREGLWLYTRMHT